ncbi:hypothetical protein OROMI_007031 [Orobanche minor]
MNGDMEDRERLPCLDYKWRLIISYDGTRFSGRWQYQQRVPTVQCIVEEALTRITKLERDRLCLVGAGRTDAGVHAWGQVAHFITPFNYDSLEGVHKALNGVLPPDIRIREMRSVMPEFHARFSVNSKIYKYRIYNDAIMDPFHRHYVYHSIYKLNPAAMRDAAKHFVGKHDFSAFANASRNDRIPNPVKNIIRFDVNEMMGRDREAEMITFDGKVVHGSTFFRYLGSIIQKDGELDGDVAYRIKAGWLKWKSATGVLCDPDMPHRLKGKFYRTAIRPALLYGTECWAVKQCHVQKMNVAEMRMLRWMCGHTKKDRLRNEVIREKVRVASIEDKMMENRLRWFGHVRRRPVDAPVRSITPVIGIAGAGTSKLMGIIEVHVVVSFLISGPLLQFEIEGSGFLYRQVRNMVGLLLQVGREAVPVDIVPKILASCDRKELAKYALSVPPHGLCLFTVSYKGDHLQLLSGSPATSLGRHHSISKCRLPLLINSLGERA